MRTVIRPGIDCEQFGRYLTLIQHQHDTGRRLPLSPAIIMHLEDLGIVVNLDTGVVHESPLFHQVNGGAPQ